MLAIIHQITFAFLVINPAKPVPITQHAQFATLAFICTSKVVILFVLKICSFKRILTPTYHASHVIIFVQPAQLPPPNALPANLETICHQILA